MYGWRGARLNAGWVTTFNSYAVVSENRLTPVPDDLDSRLVPLLGCAVTTALGVVNNDAAVGIGQSVVVYGSGGGAERGAIRRPCRRVSRGGR